MTATPTFGGFQLIGTADDETRVLVHSECGFASAIPGHPRAAAPAHHAPAYGVVVTLTDVPVELGFRADRDPGQMRPDALVTTLALAYARERSGAAPSVAPIELRAKGALAGATTMYTLGDGVMEHLVVSTGLDDAGDSWCVYQTLRFQPGELSPVEWANLRTAILSAQSWVASQRPMAQLWPRSELAQPSARMQFTQRAAQEAQAKARDIGPLTNEETSILAKRLLAFPNSDDPPGFPLGRATAELAKMQIASCAPEQASRVLLRNLDEVKTTHDFRAWCWQCIWAIGNRVDRTPDQRGA